MEILTCLPENTKWKRLSNLEANIWESLNFSYPKIHLWNYKPPELIKLSLFTHLVMWILKFVIPKKKTGSPGTPDKLKSYNRKFECERNQCPFLAKVNGIIKPEVQLSCLIYNTGLVISELIYTITWTISLFYKGTSIK